MEMVLTGSKAGNMLRLVPPSSHFFNRLTAPASGKSCDVTCRPAASQVNEQSSKRQKKNFEAQHIFCLSSTTECILGTVLSKGNSRV